MILAMLIFLVGPALATPINAADIARSSCRHHISIDSAKLLACQKLSSSDGRTTCFQRLLPGAKKIAINVDGSFDKATFDSPICLNNVALRPAGVQLTVLFDTKTDTPSVINSQDPVQIGHYKFTGRSLCGWHPTGQSTLPLSQSLKFLPEHAKLSINNPRCKENTTIDSSSVALEESAVICGMQVSRGTEFNNGVDGTVFTALDSGEMLAPDKNDPNIADVYKIKKGLNYRNRNPADTPCAWKLSPPPTETEVD